MAVIDIQTLSASLTQARARWQPRQTPQANLNDAQKRAMEEAIAVLKATLVVLFFMHVKYSSRLTWAVVLGSVFRLGILLTLTLGDYVTRNWRTFG